MTTEATTYDIPEYNIDRLNKEIATLNRRAAKIGVAPLELVIHSTQYVPCPYAVGRINRRLTKHELAELPQIQQYTVEIVGEGPKVEGYKFVGTLDHNTIPGSVLVNTVPGESVPREFFEAAAICNHCDKIRRRTETFIFEKEDGTYMQVGRSCLKDFFGQDPSHIARFLTRVMAFVGSLSDEESWGGGRGEYHFPALSVLTTTIAVIRTFGWVPRSAADAGRSATADDVQFLLLPAYGKQQQEEKQRFAASIKHNDGDIAEAEAALAWLAEQDGTKSEYMHNLQALSTLDLMPVTKFGYWCSVVSAYQRAMDKLEIKRQENINKLNEYVGEVKERIDLTVECTGIKYIESAYGAVCIHKMLTEDGRTVTWFANTDAKMDKGEKYRIKGTVKKHDEFNDWKQTTLSRVKVVETIAE